MEYQFKYNERPHFDHEELHGNEDIPSAKAVRDTAVEERNGINISALNGISPCMRSANADGLWSELCLRICHLGKSCF